MTVVWRSEGLGVPSVTVACAREQFFVHTEETAIGLCPSKASQGLSKAPSKAALKGRRKGRGNVFIAGELGSSSHGCWVAVTVPVSLGLCPPRLRFTSRAPVCATVVLPVEYFSSNGE